MERPVDVFISHHTKTCSAIAQRIAEQLEARNIYCWYAPRDTQDTYAGDIARAIRKCRVFLLILNREASFSQDVLNEINLAFLRFRERKEISIIPFHVSEDEISDDAMYYLSRLHWMDAVVPPIQKKIDALTDKVCLLLNQVPQRTVNLLTRKQSSENDVSTSVACYRLIGNAICSEPNFIGRRRELDQLVELLAASGKVLLVGMGGIGKSELARAYAAEHRADYDLTVWIPFEESLQHTLASDHLLDIQGLSRRNYAADSEREYFERKFAVLRELVDEHVLLIFDNYDVISDPDFEQLLSLRACIIFTSRCSQEVPRIQELPVDAVENPTEQLALFQAEYVRTISSGELPVLQQILSDLNGHPLSIRLLASAMMRQRLRPLQVAERLQNGGLLGGGFLKSRTPYTERIQAIFDLATLTQSEQFILKNLCLIPLGGIPVELFGEWCGLDGYDTIDDMVRRSWIVLDSVQDRIHLHPLVCEVAITQLRQDHTACSTYLESFLQLTARAVKLPWADKEELCAYLDTARRVLREQSDYVLIFQEIEANLHFAMEQFAQALPLYQNLFIQECTAEKCTILCDRLVRSLMQVHQYEEARNIALEQIRRLEAVGIPSHTIQGEYYNRLVGRVAELYHKLQDFPAAEKYARHACELCDAFCVRRLSYNHGCFTYQLASILFDAGKIDECEEVLTQAIQYYQEADEVYMMCFCDELKAKLFLQEGDLDAAWHYSCRMYDTLEKIVGKNNMGTYGQIRETVRHAREQDATRD